MFSTSTPPVGFEFLNEIGPWFFARIAEETAKTFRMFWDIGMAYLSEHWVAILAGLFVVFVIALVWAFLTRHWRMLGSIVYNYLYFGVLFLVGLIWGPEVFANDYFKIFLAILYGVCFWTTGRFLTKIGVR